MSEGKTRDELFGLGDGVSALQLELEKMIVDYPPAVRQQALAVVLWRTMNGDGVRDGEWTMDGVRLLDGGRRIVAECTMTPPKGTRVR